MCNVKCKVYEVINKCLQALKSKEGVEELEPQLSDEQTMLLNKELFAIELTSMNDLNRFLNFEITNFQTIGDLAQKLQGQIASRKFKPVNEVL